MAAQNRVEELRKRYHENPRRFFAPLANEYRKTGFPDRAILLCEKHLGEQPDNLNGLVVYGQTLFETGRHADAKGPFEAALNLDPENLIALRHLGDIAREAGDHAEARTWYGRVLEFDRRNEEVLALLESVGGATREPPSGPSSAPSIVNVASSVRVTTGGTPGPTAVGMIDIDAGAGREAPSVPRPRVSTPAGKTLEVTAQPKAPKRASLMNIAFDFGEGQGTATPPPPTPRASQQPPALEDMPTLVTEPPQPPRTPTPRTPTPRIPTPRAPTPTVAPLIDLPPEPVELGSVGRIEGLEAAEFSAEVSPLSGLEPSEFESGDASPLAGLESDGFMGLGDESAAGESFAASVEDPEAELPSLPADEDDFGGTMAFTASRLDELGPPPLEAPIPRPTEGLPLLDVESPYSAEPEPVMEVEPEPVMEVEPEPISEPMVETALEPEPLSDSESTVPPTPFVTETMAELYVRQGHRDQAIEVYRQLIVQSPGDAGLRERLAALEAATRASIEFEVPSEVQDETPPPAPANAMLAEMSFDGVALVTPSTASRPIRMPTPPASSPAIPPASASPAAPVRPSHVTGPTAREFLGAFARRGFTPLSSPVIPATPSPSPSPSAVPGGGLDLLFGADVQAEDDRAAHRLAGVGATAGPSGGSALDSLFGEGPSAPMPTMAPAGRPGGGRASDRLRFDQFFTPTADEAIPVVEAPSVSEPVVEEPASAAPPPEDDDLDQFQGWLRGLTQ